MVDYSALLYDPVYAEIGVPAVFAGGTVGEVALTVIDDTRPKTAVAGSLEVRSVGPGAFARIPELTENGIARDDYVDATLTFNGRIWTVRSYELRGSPNGEDLGEVRFLLKDGQVVPEPEPDFPNASNTGVQDGITLTPASNVTISTSGVYENRDVTGDTLVINANDVTVRNCRISVGSGNSAVVYVVPGKTGVKIEYCDIIGIPGASGLKAVWIDTADGVEVAFCDISGTEDGLYAFGNDTNFHDNYVHDQLSSSGDPHFDCVQFSGTGILITHNSLIGTTNSNACAQFGNHTGPVSVTFDNNLMRPGDALVLFNVDDDVPAVACTYHVINNHLEAGNLGAGNPYIVWDVNPPATWTGNVDADTGAAISPP